MGPRGRTGLEVPAGRLICPCLPQEEDGSTCLHHAAKIGNLEMVSLLLSTGQVDVNAQVRGPAALPPFPLPATQPLGPRLSLRLQHLPHRLASDPSLHPMLLQLFPYFSLLIQLPIHYFLFLAFFFISFQSNELLL